MSRLEEYCEYHWLMEDIGDTDPSYPMLRYVCERFELNTEQRYWLAFLFACTYCAPTVFYIYNEFPDFENVDTGRLERWWRSRGRVESIFQTDRAWIRSRNQFVEVFESYRELIRSTQEQEFCGLFNSDPKETYRRAYKYFSRVKQFGRFAMFLYLESVHVVTGFPMKPDTLNLKEAESSCNGLCYAIGREDLLRGKQYGNQKLPEEAYPYLQLEFERVMETLQKQRPGARVDAWNTETTLCAFKKFKRGTRYPGYYLDRQYREILASQQKVTHGVDWSVLWDFRRETYNPAHLAEYKGGMGNNGKLL